MEEEREVRGVRISIFGKAFCTWRIGTGDDETTYSGEKIYINRTANLIKSKEGIKC